MKCEAQMDSTSIPPCDNLGNSDQPPPNTIETISFGHHWCGYAHHKNTSSTPFQIWFTQNVYPLVTPKRIFHFCVSQTSFFLAFGFFTQTKLYNSYIYGGDHHTFFHEARPLLFLAGAFGIHTFYLIFLLFFSFFSVAFERYRYHYILKSLGEYLVRLFVVFLIMGIVEEHAVIDIAAPAPALNCSDDEVEFSKIAGLVTWCLLTVDALSIINLLEPGDHYSLLEATVTLTLHLGLAAQNSLRIPVAAFVLVILVIKNYQGRHVDHPKPPMNEPRPVAWVASEVV